MPPAFVLSQDQTLRKNKFLSDCLTQAYSCSGHPPPERGELPKSSFDSVVSTAQSSFRFHRTIQFSNSSQFPRNCVFSYYSTLFRPVKSNFDFFRNFLPPAIEISSAPLSRRVRFNIAQVFPLSNPNPNFFRIFFGKPHAFISPACSLFRGAYHLI